MFRACVIATRMALATASKGSSTVAEYYTKMKGLADEMASVGRKLDDEELISYILTCLDFDFDSVVSAIAARVEPITVAGSSPSFTPSSSPMNSAWS
jgi:hypothetical protein